jgi:hypothetical protein
MRARKIGTISLALLWFSLAAVPGAQGQKLLVTAVSEADGALKVLAFFPDGKPAQDAPVAVISEDGHATVEGKTDDQGALKIARLKAGHYRVEVGDPLGHRAETRVVIAGEGLAPASGAPPATVSGFPVRFREALPWGNILGGLGFIFGLTAFLMVLRLRREMKKHAPRD